jgi:hypothetical protein
METGHEIGSRVGTSIETIEPFSRFYIRSKPSVAGMKWNTSTKTINTSSLSTMRLAFLCMRSYDENFHDVEK